MSGRVTAAQVAEVIADELMDRVVANDPGLLKAGPEVAVIDIAIKEGDRAFGVQLSDGQVFAVAVYPVYRPAPAPAAPEPGWPRRSV